MNNRDRKILKAANDAGICFVCAVTGGLTVQVPATHEVVRDLVGNVSPAGSLVCATCATNFADALDTKEI